MTNILMRWAIHTHAKDKKSQMIESLNLWEVITDKRNLLLRKIPKKVNPQMNMTMSSHMGGGETHLLPIKLGGRRTIWS